MKLTLNILFAVLGLWVQFSVTEANAEALPYHPQYAIRRHTQLVAPAKNLTEPQRQKLMEMCGGNGFKCNRAEQCCSLKCLKYSKICIL
ncbi:hypothetical protein ACLKA7_003737 [Drosophila subpalustris]